MANAADGDDCSVILQVARRDDGESNVGGSCRLLESLQRLYDQICWRRIHDLVEDSEVDGRDVLAVCRIALHNLAQNVFHNFVEMVFVERVGQRFVTPFNFVSEFCQLRR